MGIEKKVETPRLKDAWAMLYCDPHSIESELEADIRSFLSDSDACIDRISIYREEVDVDPKTFGLWKNQRKAKTLLRFRCENEDMETPEEWEELDEIELINQRIVVQISLRSDNTPKLIQAFCAMVRTVDGVHFFKSFEHKDQSGDLIPFYASTTTDTYGLALDGWRLLETRYFPELQEARDLVNQEISELDPSELMMDNMRRGKNPNATSQAERELNTMFTRQQKYVRQKLKDEIEEIYGEGNVQILQNLDLPRHEKDYHFSIWVKGNEQ